MMSSNLVGYYRGKPCMMKPVIVEASDEYTINRAIATGFSTFARNHIKVGECLSLFNIHPRLEDVDIYDFEEYVRHTQYGCVIKGKLYSNTEQAYHVFESTFKKLVLEFEYE